MTQYIEKDGYIVVKRHWILLLIKIMKFIFFIFVGFFLFWIDAKYGDKITDISYMKYIFFFVSFSVLNYAFVSFISYLIEYYNNLIIIYKEQIFAIRSSFILRDDIENLDPYRIMTLDSFSHGIFANIFNYGDITIEQVYNERDDVRTFHFVPDPYKLLGIIKDQRKKTLDDRKKKYIIADNLSNNINSSNVNIKKD